jgi:hypothetical protein
MTKLDIKIILDDYIDMIYIYEIICNDTYNYYYNLKFMFEFPIIFINVFMTVINSTITDMFIIKHSNIFLNVMTMLLVSLSNYLKITEKCEILKITRDKFIKLYNMIEKRKYTDDISIDFIDNVITNYDNIIDNINFTFPSKILKRVRNEYGNKKTLPLFINGIKKLDKYRYENGIITPNSYNVSISDINEIVVNDNHNDNHNDNNNDNDNDNDKIKLIDKK